MDFSKFDKQFDIEGLKQDMKEAAENGTDFPEIPEGTYEVKIDKMELAETGPNSKQPGSPMVKIQFRITDGKFKNSCIFFNQVVTLGFQLHIVTTFLRSLGSGIAIDFSGYAALAELLMDVHEAIDGKLEYALKYGKNSKGFNTYEIVEVFEVE